MAGLCVLVLLSSVATGGESVSGMVSSTSST